MTTTNNMTAKNMPVPDFERAKAYAKKRLENDLPAVLVYHSLAHTEDEVVASVERLSPLESVHGSDLLLLRTASWFHDLGFVEQTRDHETISVRIAREVLPVLGYSADAVERITAIIMATRLPQTPQDRLGAIIADADLDVFAQPSFLERNGQLRAELATLGKTFTDVEWYRNQCQFLQNHTYFTVSARRLNAAAKERAIAMLETFLRRAEQSV